MFSQTSGTEWVIAPNSWENLLTVYFCTRGKEAKADLKHKTQGTSSQLPLYWLWLLIHIMATTLLYLWQAEWQAAPPRKVPVWTGLTQCWWFQSTACNGPFARKSPARKKLRQKTNTSHLWFKTKNKNKQTPPNPQVGGAGGSRHHKRVTKISSHSSKCFVVMPPANQEAHEGGKGHFTYSGTENFSRPNPARGT